MTVKDFIEKHQSELKVLFDQKEDNNESITLDIEDLPLWDADLPY